MPVGRKAGETQMIPKDFQEATAERIFEIFRDEGQNHILLADEVGLGKTIIASDVISKVAEWHRIEKNDDFFKVIYICSNINIASQNCRKLGIDIFGVKKLVIWFQSRIPHGIGRIVDGKLGLAIRSHKTGFQSAFNRESFTDRMHIICFCREYIDDPGLIPKYGRVNIHILAITIHIISILVISRMIFEPGIIGIDSQ